MGVYVKKEVRRTLRWSIRSLGDVDGVTYSFENDNNTEKEFKKMALESEGYGDTITYDQLLNHISKNYYR